jgi:hypothetical protein
MSHPISDRSLYRFASGTASREEGQAVLSHLLQGCAPCAQKLSAVTGFSASSRARALQTSSVTPRRPASRRPATLQ